MTDEICCESTVVHEQTVREVEKKIPDEDLLYDVAELFKIFGDSTRIRILSAIPSGAAGIKAVRAAARCIIAFCRFAPVAHFAPN